MTRQPDRPIVEAAKTTVSLVVLAPVALIVLALGFILLGYIVTHATDVLWTVGIVAVVLWLAHTHNKQEAARWAAAHPHYLDDPNAISPEVWAACDEMRETLRELEQAQNLAAQEKD